MNRSVFVNHSRNNSFIGGQRAKLRVVLQGIVSGLAGLSNSSSIETGPITFHSGSRRSRRPSAKMLFCKPVLPTAFETPRITLPSSLVIENFRLAIGKPTCGHVNLNSSSSLACSTYSSTDPVNQHFNVMRLSACYVSCQAEPVGALIRLSHCVVAISQLGHDQHV